MTYAIPLFVVITMSVGFVIGRASIPVTTPSMTLTPPLCLQSSSIDDHSPAWEMEQEALNKMAHQTADSLICRATLNGAPIKFAANQLWVKRK